MALVKCENCGQPISEKALKCPKCGTPIQKKEKITNQSIQVLPDQMEHTEALHSEQKSKKPQSRKAIIAVCGVLVALLIFGGGIFLYNRTDRDASDNNGKALYSVELVGRAEKGDAAAQFVLGVCYANGDGVSQDYNEAVRWFRKSAEQGNSDAQFSLGLYYYYGNGVSQDYNEAVKWFQKSAEQGNTEGQLNLGLCYLDGNGVTRDYNEAVRWFRKSAEQGYADGQYALGLCYFDGKGVSQDYDEAVKWFRKSAEQGLTPAIEMLRDIEAESFSEKADASLDKVSSGLTFRTFTESFTETGTGSNVVIQTRLSNEQVIKNLKELGFKLVKSETKSRYNHIDEVYYDAAIETYAKTVNGNTTTVIYDEAGSTKIIFPTFDDVKAFEDTVKGCGLTKGDYGFEDAEEIYWAGTDVYIEGKTVILHYKSEA